MKPFGFFLVLGIYVFFGACSRVVTNSIPDNTPETNFELLWQEYDRLYVSFESKGVDWDAVYTVYRSQVTPQSTNQELFDIMSAMLGTLKDGHVDLFAPLGHYSYKG